MSGRGEDSDSDAPEEFTSQQVIAQDEEITKVQKENKARVLREGKERRRKWAEKLTPKPVQEEESIEDSKEIESQEEFRDNKGMLPDEIVKLLAAREKKVFSSDSEDEKPKKTTTSKKKRTKKSGPELIILDEIPPPQCLQSSLEFLKKRKMQVSRSSAVLNNSNKALRFLSTSTLLGNKT
ncbi:hypothetical protein M9H77_15715 [Catharanthus roseus]|uniref:Uncharacterized protein n=1 Tax=Catharanthus roseus TaxID=4058 RepID=A0ACC0AXW8_CATRO|nr:hypothetical protein M9H77_15715 [Catharanthus roseus]